METISIKRKTFTERYLSHPIELLKTFFPRELGQNMLKSPATSPSSDQSVFEMTKYGTKSDKSKNNINCNNITNSRNALIKTEAETTNDYASSDVTTDGMTAEFYEGTLMDSFHNTDEIKSETPIVESVCDDDDAVGNADPSLNTIVSAPISPMTRFSRESRRSSDVVGRNIYSSNDSR